MNYEKSSKVKLFKKVFVIILPILFVLILFPFALVKFDPGLAGNFADKVLRPVIGANNTLALESTLFNIEDKFNIIKYKYVKPQLPSVNNEKISSQSQNSNTISPSIEDYSMQLKPISMFYFTPLSGEGVWNNYPLAQFPNKEVMATTFVRPDPNRNYAIVTLIKINMKYLNIGAVAGTVEPGSSLGNPGPGKVPLSIQNANTLVAAFAGGFQYSDGAYGMIVGGKTYVPLENNLATFVAYKNGTNEIIDYIGQNLGDPTSILFIRQNNPMLVENSMPDTTTQSGGYKAWGRTVTPNMYTWRSALGITKNGNLIYAVGPSLVPTTIAEALSWAGAVNGMQLDINPYWVRFVTFTPKGNGQYSYQSLLNTMQNGGYSYLNGYIKDFMYLYAK